MKLFRSAQILFYGLFAVLFAALCHAVHFALAEPGVMTRALSSLFPKLIFGVDSVVAGHVGPVYSGDGIETTALRQGAHGEAIVAQYGGKYKEAVRRASVYSACTAATGVAPGTALGTTAAFCLYNPAGNSKRFTIQRITMGLISGTLGAGVVWITSDGTSAAVPTGTAITPRNRDVGSANNSTATALTTATVTTGAAKMIGILCSLNQGVIATTAINNEVISQDIDGEIIVEPGCSITLQATAAAGSTPLVVFCVTWEEESINS